MMSKENGPRNPKSIWQPQGCWMPPLKMEISSRLLTQDCEPISPPNTKTVRVSKHRNVSSAALVLHEPLSYETISKHKEASVSNIVLRDSG